MPEFTLTGRADAPVEEVWKLLFDPSRFPEWWHGFDTVRPDGPGAFTWWLTGYPDDPMPQRLRTDHDAGRVTISCQVRDVVFAWRLTADGDGTALEVRLELAEAEVHRAEDLQAMLGASLRTLAGLAASSVAR
jgi:uncharacterized protein YndB with AHSA1/START domain